jgi:hypothetical protein
MRGHQKQHGYVIITIAATLVILLGFVAFAVDLGMFLSARTAAQRAADAAALAGAFTFIVHPFGAQPQTAQQYAVNTAVTNNILDNPVNAADVTVNVDVPNRLVIVDVMHTRATFFAGVLGLNQATIGARGIAEASANSTGSSCSKPWFIPNTVLSPNSACQACANGEVFVSGGNVTGFGQGMVGTSFTLKPGNPQNSLAPGQFYAIRMGDSTGGNDYRTNIATCTPELVYCQETYSVEPGNMIGPTLQGVNDLMGPNPDTFLALGQYQRSDGTIGDTSRQLISAPIWDECGIPGFCPGEQLPDAGANLQIPVVGFALIFLEGVQGNDVIARLLGVSGCGAGGGGGGGGGGGPAPPETGPYSIPVRLVRLP